MPPKPRDTAERFWEKVDIRGAGDCWEWQAGQNSYGYGVFRINGMTRTSHRISYGLSTGPITDGLFVLHSCDNRKCCNPAHLRLGTQQENLNDARVRKRLDTRGERHGVSKLTEDDVLHIRDMGGSQREIGRQFGVCQQQICAIRARRAWKHV